MIWIGRITGRGTRSIVEVGVGKGTGKINNVDGILGEDSDGDGNGVADGSAHGRYSGLVYGSGV